MFRPGLHSIKRSLIARQFHNQTLYSAKQSFLPSRVSLFPKFKIRKNFYSSAVKSGGSASAAQPKKQGKLQELIRKYGVSALGVYLFLSCIDLPICFYFVHQLGELKIKLYINNAKRFVGFSEKSDQDIEQEVLKHQAEQEEQNKLQKEREESGLDNEASKKFSLQRYWDHLKNTTLLTEFLIAYGIHKSLIFIRLPITAAITPSVVRTLQRMGFKINTKAASPTPFINKGAASLGGANPANKYSLQSTKTNEKTKKWFGLF
ncbi:hypothetical protein ACO0RG_002359 [Hanseniaspora osmophila]|mgnify:CR=1 FL=1